jgi:hypothetical protein
LRLVPDQPYGALVAAIWDGKHPIKEDTKGPIKENREFDVKSKGELVLVVNDILLNHDAKNLYVLPLDKDNEIFYEARVKEEIQDVKAFEMMSKEKKLELARKLFEKRERSWGQISQLDNWTVWFDDNVGYFFVSITKASSSSRKLSSLPFNCYA